MRYPTREYQCANRRRTLPLGQAFNLIATRVLDSVVHIIGGECAISMGLVARVFMHGDERKCISVGLAKHNQPVRPFYVADANKEFSSIVSSGTESRRCVLSPQTHFLTKY